MERRERYSGEESSVTPGRVLGSVCSVSCGGLSRVSTKGWTTPPRAGALFLVDDRSPSDVRRQVTSCLSSLVTAVLSVRVRVRRSDVLNTGPEGVIVLTP